MKKTLYSFSMPDSLQIRMKFFLKMTSISEGYWEERDISLTKSRKKTRKGKLRLNKKPKGRP